MKAKELGRKQESKPFNDTNDVYDFQYNLQNATKLLNENQKITPEDKQKIWQFVDLLGLFE